MKPSPDPYRTLGVLRGADREQIKAAHRRLAKLYHPDGSTGDEVRFLAVQEAYQLLSDPLRRRDWDRRHAPGPVPARGGPTGTPRGAPPPRPPPRRWTAARVPGWEGLRPRNRPASSSHVEPEHDEEASSDPDVFTRSSGAAWSAAARRHFRRGTEDLPSRGVWRYRGTQVVTGAEARRVAAEEEEEDTSR